MIELIKNKARINVINGFTIENRLKTMKQFFIADENYARC